MKRYPFFYGWVIVWANFIVLGSAWGIGQGTFGVFVNPMVDELGWSRASISAIYSISMLVSFSFGTVWGWLSDHWSVRGVILVAGVLLGSGLFLSSFANALWQFYLSYGLIGGAGLGGTSATLIGLASRWFDRRRGLAIGISFAGPALGGAFLPVITEYLMSQDGWRFAFRTLSFIVWGSFIVGILLIKNPPPGTKQTEFRRNPNLQNNTTCSRTFKKPEQYLSVPLKKALLTSEFWILFGMICMPELLSTMILVHLVPAATDVGITSSTAASLLTVLGISKVIGLFVGGTFGDIVGHRKVYVISMLIQGIPLLLLTVGSDLWLFYVFAIIFGIGTGAWSPQFPAIATNTFGLQHIGAILGAVLLGAGLGGVIGPIFAGYLFDTLGDYRVAFLIGPGIAVFGMLLSLQLKQNQQKQVPPSEV